MNPLAPLPSLVYFANHRSPHAKRWLDLLTDIGQEPNVFSLESPIPGEPFCEHCVLLPASIYKTGPVRYILAGCLVRLGLLSPGGGICHAHSASGYGIAAWLSGRPYIVTTYGTEVYSANERGPIYRCILRRVLSAAAAITATSPAMVSYLHEELGIPEDRVHLFSLGIDTVIFSDTTGKDIDHASPEPIGGMERPVWVMNRRITPLYRTIETIEAFFGYKNAGAPGSLVLFAGDHDPTYLRQVRDLLANSSSTDSVCLVEGILPQSLIAEYLSAADYALSVPKSDQLSASILEAMACGAVPILADLRAYDDLRDSGAVIWVERCDVPGLEAVFKRSRALGEQDRGMMVKRGQEYVATHASNEVAAQEVRSFYQKVGRILSVEAE